MADLRRRDNTLTGLGTERKPRFGRYKVLRKISEGATSLIFVAKTDHPAGFEKVAALKVIRPELVDDPRRIETFLQEARVSARIDHANVCNVFDFGEDNGFYYIAMEYLVGETLSRILNTTRAQGLAREAATHRMVARIIAHACEGLHAAHELTDDKGNPLSVVHRDVCPDNIIVTYDGQVRVVDFGLSRAALDDGDFDALASSNHLPYLAPEQARGKVLDRRADIWSLGTILWEGLAGSRLFDGNSRNEIVFQMASQDIVSPEDLRWPVADVFAQVALRALNREVDERYADARTMGERLELALQATGNAIGASAISAWMHALFPGQGERKKRFLSSIPPPIPPEARHPPYVDDQNPTKAVVDTPFRGNENTTQKKNLPEAGRLGAQDLLDTKTLDVRGMVAPSRRQHQRGSEQGEAFEPDTSTFTGVGSEPAQRRAQREATREFANAELHEVETAEDVRVSRAVDLPDIPGDADADRKTKGARPVSWLFVLFFVGVGALLAVFRHDLVALVSGSAVGTEAAGTTEPAPVTTPEEVVVPTPDAGVATEVEATVSAARSHDAGEKDAAQGEPPDADVQAREPIRRAQREPPSSRRDDREGRVREPTARRSPKVEKTSSDWIVDPESEGEETPPTSKENEANKKEPDAPSGIDWIID